MKRIMVVGSLGQIGTALVRRLRKDYGSAAVMAADLRRDEEGILQDGPFEVLDARDGAKYAEIAANHGADTIMHLAGILSAKAENKPQEAWDINMGGLYNALEVARERHCALFFPSSIAAFGPGTPQDRTPQDTIQRPTTIYGVTKVAGELLCEYYHKKWGVDARGVRFPGLISYDTAPGGGTTDYAVHIYHEALSKGRYSCYIAQGTYMDMMYMPDAMDGIIQLMEADPSKLRHRCCFNITAMSFAPEEIASAITKRISHFVMDYQVDPLRQAIAESWPNSLDDSAAREEWGWNPKFDLESMTDHMLQQLSLVQP